MTIPFEATRSYVYKAARYELLPRIVEIVRDYGDEPFLLREISKRVMADTYTIDQLELKVKKAKSDATEKMSTIFGFYIPFLAENLKVFENLGGGKFRNISLTRRLRKLTQWRRTSSQTMQESSTRIRSLRSSNSLAASLSKSALRGMAMPRRESASNASRLVVLSTRKFS